MSRANFTIDFQGLGEFQDKINTIIRDYPYEAEELLTKSANSFRNEVKKRTPIGKDTEYTKKKYGAKRKKLHQRYKVKKPEGYGRSIHVDFYSTAPHYHLIERGHRIVYRNRAGEKIDTGKRTKPVEMVKQTSDEFKTTYPKNVEKYVKKVVKRLS